MTERRFRLRDDLVTVEQVYRGQRSFIVKDRLTSKYFRFRPVEVDVMRQFHAPRSAEEAAAALRAQGLNVTTGVVEGFARKLAHLGLMERTLAERTTLELERTRAEKSRRRRPAWLRGELMRLRWSFGDPDSLFERTMPMLRWCFSRGFVIASIVLFVAYAALIVGGWGDFTRDFAAVYAPRNLTVGAIVVFWVTLLGVTAVHELAHGYMCKRYGGEVREMGFMLIYLQPAFYCNVNDAWSFPELHKRLWVTAAGSWIQLVLAGIAAVIWAVSAPGTLAWQMSLAAVAVGGLGSILANANPLIPLDGYFALSDWLEIPNLRMRARAYLGWWIRTRLLRTELPEPPATDREKRIFLLYAALAAVYTGGLLLVIATLLIGWVRRVVGGLGVALILLAIGIPLWRSLRAWGPSLQHGARALAARWRAAPWRHRATIGLGVLLLALAVLPWPLRTAGTFVTAPLARFAMASADSGVVEQVYVREGSVVEQGAPLVRLRNRALERERFAAALAVDSLGIAAARARATGSSAAERLETERTAAAARLAALTDRAQRMTVRAPARGVVTTPWPEDLLGRRLDEGDPIVELVSRDAVEARITLAGAGAALVRPGQRVSLISLADVAEAHTAEVTSVAALGNTPGAGVEARVRLRGADAWRPGVTGRASVRFGRSTVLGAAWWGVRRRLRTDLLL